MPQPYKLSPAFFVSLRKRFFITFVLPLLLACAGGIYFAAAKTQINNGLFASIPILLVIVVFQMWRTYRRQKQIWASYRIFLEPESISRTQESFSTVSISKDEITAIKQVADGSIVLQASGAKKELVIPGTLENLAGLQTMLAEWHPIEAVAKKTSPIWLTYAGVILMLGALGIVALGKNPALVACAGLFLLVVMIASLIYVQRSGHFDKKVKFNIWVVIVPILAIAARLYGLFF